MGGRGKIFYFILLDFIQCPMPHALCSIPVFLNKSATMKTVWYVFLVNALSPKLKLSSPSLSDADPKIHQPGISAPRDGSGHRAKRFW